MDLKLSAFVTQDTLRRIRAAELVAVDAKDTYTQAVGRYDAIADPVLASLLGRIVKVEVGNLLASVEWSERRCPSYREWIAKRHGQDTIAEILRLTQPTRTPRLEVRP